MDSFSEEMTDKKPRKVQGRGGIVGLPPAPREKKPKPKRARIERQKARTERQNESPQAEPPQNGTAEPTLEDRYASAMTLVEPVKTPKNPLRLLSTFTGFRELGFTDMLVLLVLWFVRFIVPWVEAWHEFVLHLLVDPRHWKILEKYFIFHQIMAYNGKVVLCFAVSLLVDLINFKYPTYSIVLLLYIFAPVVGFMVAILLVARSYDVAYYEQWWHITIVMMMWAKSTPFIAFPVQFSCIFDQTNNMSRLAHYNWTSIFVFIEALSASICFGVIPPICPTRYFTIFAVWCGIGLLILVLAIQVLSFMRWAKPHTKSLHLPKKNKSGTAEATGETKTAENSRTSEPNATLESENEPTKALRRKKLMWFLLMLIPIIFSSFTYGILKRTRPEEDWDKHNLVSATGMLVNGQCLGVLLVVPALFAIRKLLKNPGKMKILSPDMMALGLPHIINTVALAVIMARFWALAALDEGDVVVGPIPTQGVSVVEFYNVEFRNRSICIHSEYFGPLKVPPQQRATSVLKDPGVAVITFNLTLDPITTPPVPTFGNFTFEKGVWITYIVTLPSSQLGSSNIEAFYGELQLIRVNGTDETRPKKEPLVVFINTYVVFIDGWYYNITFSGKTQTINQIHKGIAMSKNYPPGELTITYWTEWENLVKLGSHPPINGKLSVDNYCVYTVLLCLSNTMKQPWNFSEVVPRTLRTFKTMEIAGPASEKFPSKEELEKDKLMILGFALAGMARAGVYIGYIYLFWLDFPLKGFRTTVLAVTWIFVGFPEELAADKVIDIGAKQVTILFVLQILFTGLHFTSAVFLYTPKFNFRARPD